MKLWSLVTLFVFLNFTALPTVAAVMDWDLQQSNMVINEEETHSSNLVVYEKALPRTMNVHDFLKFFETESLENPYFGINESIHYSPYLTIFSPPPEA